MKYKIYQVDAFANEVFSGNPAAVCPLDQWMSDKLLQQIAMENNLSETAFYVQEGDHYLLRWFTPTVEVDLCGHATLAAAFVLFNHENHSANTIDFFSPRSGRLSVKRENEYLTLNFPTDVVEEIELTDELMNGFDLTPLKALKGKSDFILVYENENQIKNLKPNLSQIAKVPGRGVIATAKGDSVDFVSRFFAPQVGVNEDPVTGSAHTTLTAYWAKQLGKTTLTAAQLSARGGHLKCTLIGDRVEISGQAKLYMKGQIYFE